MLCTLINNEEETKVYKWVKAVIRRAKNSTGSVPPQGEIISSASRTRARMIKDAPERRQDHSPEPGDFAVTDGLPAWRSPEAIFEAYLQGDLEAAAITEGWALKHRATASASGPVHTDARRTHDPYALRWRPRRGLRCALGLHDDGTDVFGGYSAVCLRCGGPS